MRLKNRKIAILAGNLYEDLELWVPYYRMLEEGAQVTVLGTGGGSYESKHGYPVKEDRNVTDVQASEFDAVIIPGGYAPDHMRRSEAMVSFVRTMANDGRVVAFICHAGWLAASAGILRGKRATSFFSIRDDMTNAGAEWVDRECVRDGNLISSRKPSDLPAFCRTIVDALAER